MHSCNVDCIEKWTMLFDGDLLLDMEMTIYEDLMVKCGGFSVTLSGSHFQFRTPFTSVPHPTDDFTTLLVIYSSTRPGQAK